MDWKMCAHLGVFLLLLISLQCSCNWDVQVNKGKDKYGNITWQEVRYSPRQKRTWIAPPLGMREEEDNRYRNPIAKVHSDLQVKKGTVLYRLTGQGVDQPPYNVFIMDPKTGYLNVTDARIDREQTPMLEITAHAVTIGGQEIEKPLRMIVKIQDINDNPPVFSQAIFAGQVEERSQTSTLVMVINAFDADEPNTVNSQIAYKILSQTPSNPPMFMINQYTGEVYTISNLLDRETYSTYSIMVSGSDLNGGAGGLSGQCGADIKIQDVNDNFPVLEFDTYSVNIQENWMGLSDLRMKVFDADEMYSDNWAAVFEIVSGNEGGWFVIDTDSQTNEGMLRVVKHLDYESMKLANLGFIVSNRAAYHYSVMSEYQAKMTSIKVQVENVVEAPVFNPDVINLNIPHGLSQDELMQYVLAKVSAMNVETGQAATNVVYMLDSTTARYFVIDSTTGEIKMTYEMARGNGPDAPTGNYTGLIFAITDDEPVRTATATVVANIGPDPGTVTPAACPVLNLEPKVICLDTRRAIVSASQEPSGAPYTITLLNNPDWYLDPLNSTAVYLIARPSVSPQNYSLVFNVVDKNNVACPQPFQVTVPACDCTPSGTCDALKTSGKSTSLGPAAIGLMVLGFLALLLALLLLPLCVCGAAAGSKFIPVAGGYDGAFHQWGTEGGKPEDVDMTSMLINSAGAGSEVQTSNYLMPMREEVERLGAGDCGVGVGGIGGVGSGMRAASTNGFDTTTFGDGKYGMEKEFSGSMVGTLPPSYKEGATLNMAYVENYFADKAEAFANEDENRPSNDCLLIYDNEGVGSPAGSVGCCSFIGDDLDDDYLDTLGPKFKTLAEICIGSEIDMPGAQPRSFPYVPIVETDTNVMVEESSMNYPGNRSVTLNNSAYVTETFMPPANLQPAMPVPGNVVVTETYMTAENSMRPVVRAVEPTSILVTERVVGSSSAPVFTNVPSNSSNVIVTERVLRPASGVHEFIEVPNYQSLPDASNVVVTERVVGPSTSTRPRQSTAFSFPDFGDNQNVVVTERVIQPYTTETVLQPISTERVLQPITTERVLQPITTERVLQPITTERVLQPISNVQGGLTIRPDMGSSQNIYVTEKTVRSGPATTTHMLSADPLLMQSVGSTSPSLTRSVRTYSTVQYTQK